MFQYVYIGAPSHNRKKKHVIISPKQNADVIEKNTFNNVPFEGREYAGPEGPAKALSGFFGGLLGGYASGNNALGYEVGTEAGENYWNWYDKKYFDAEENYRKMQNDRYNWFRKKRAEVGWW